VLRVVGAEACVATQGVADATEWWAACRTLTPMTTNLLRRAVAVTVIAGSAVTLSACGSSSSKSSTTTTTPSTCASLQKLQSSVDSLKNINVAQQGTDGVKSSLNDVKSAAQNVKKSAKNQFGSDVDALENSISKLGDDLKAGKGSQSIVDWAQQLGDDVTAVVDSFDQLQTAAQKGLKDCNLKSN
jgi:hypothetical protein